MAQRQQQQQVVVNREEVRRIVCEKDYPLLVSKAEEWGRELERQGLRMSQIRRIFGEVKRLTMRWEPVRLRMLRPKLAYIAKRAGRGGEVLRSILTPAIDAVFQDNDETAQRERFRVLADLFEAVLAYFTYYERGGGR